MKESQRLHPPAHTTFQRLVMRDTTLSDGIILPKGARIEIAASPTYNDPAIWDNPDEFDALRFMHLRENGQEKGSHQFATANSDYILWGQGKHACPGSLCSNKAARFLLTSYQDASLQPMRLRL